MALQYSVSVRNAQLDQFESTTAVTLLFGLRWGGVSGFASPSTGRPALEVGFLRGHESPELFQKASNQQRIGGSASPMDGSFEDDTTAYKVRHVFGGTRLDPKSTVASNGSGS